MTISNVSSSWAICIPEFNGEQTKLTYHCPNSLKLPTGDGSNFCSAGTSWTSSVQWTITLKCNFHTYSVQLTFDEILQSYKSEATPFSQGKRVCVAIFFHLSSALFCCVCFFAIIMVWCGITLYKSVSCLIKFFTATLANKLYYLTSFVAWYKHCFQLSDDRSTNGLCIFWLSLQGMLFSDCSMLLQFKVQFLLTTSCTF